MEVLETGVESGTVEYEMGLMARDVVRRGSNLLLKTKLIILRLYWVQVHLCQRDFSFDRFV